MTVTIGNDNGQYKKGNPRGPRQPKLQTERAHLEVVIAVCTPETWREVVHKAVEDCKASDAKARKWLSSYLMGRPGQTALRSSRWRFIQNPAQTEASAWDLTLPDLRSVTKVRLKRYQNVINRADGEKSTHCVTRAGFCLVEANGRYPVLQAHLLVSRSNGKASLTRTS
jgi:hypothetical protein